MTYEERNTLRGNTLEKIFKENSVIENFVRDNWQPTNYMPSNNEIEYACNQMVIIVKKNCKDVIEDPEIYDRLCKECKEIKERFWKLNAERPIEAYCGIYQVNTYLYEEAFDLLSEALNLYVPKEDYYEF